MRLEFFRHHRVDRQHDFALARFGRGHDLLRGGGQVSLGKAFPNTFAEAKQESIGHGAADDQHVDFFEQMAEQIELGGNLGAANDGRERVRRLVEHFLEGLQFGLQRASGIGRQNVPQTLGRGMRAMRGRERVVDPDVAELGERRDEGWIVFFLARIEARVLQADDVALLHRRHRALSGLADAVVDEFHRPLEDMGDLSGHRLERLLRVAPLRAAEMREQDHLGALVGDLGDRVRHALDAGGVGDHAVLHRHVEIDAHQHAFALHVDVVEGAERAHGLLEPARR